MFDLLYELYYCTVIAVLVTGTLFFFASSLLWLNIVDSSEIYNSIAPLYMNGSSGTESGAGPSAELSASIAPRLVNSTIPLECYPAYQEVNNLDDMLAIKRNLLALKQEVNDRLIFRTPQIYIDQLNGLNEYAARPNPHRSHLQVANLERHFKDAASNLE